jgi:hypothetical protein
MACMFAVLEQTPQPMKHDLFPPSFGCEHMPSRAFLTATALLCILVPALSGQSTTGWLLGPEGMSCDDACPREPGTNKSTCYVDSMKAVRTFPRFGRVASVLNLNEFDCTGFSSGDLTTYPAVYQYHTSSPVCEYSAQGGSTCNASDRAATRLCCCGGPCSWAYAPKWIDSGVNVDIPIAHWDFDLYASPI